MFVPKNPVFCSGYKQLHLGLAIRVLGIVTLALLRDELIWFLGLILLHHGVSDLGIGRVQLVTGQVLHYASTNRVAQNICGGAQPISEIADENKQIQELLLELCFSWPKCTRKSYQSHLLINSDVYTSGSLCHLSLCCVLRALCSLCLRKTVPPSCVVFFLTHLS